MNLREKAEELALRLFPDTGPPPQTRERTLKLISPEIDAIERALKQVRDETLEVAAKVADEDAEASRTTITHDRRSGYEMSIQYEEGRVKGGTKIAQRIRALKEQ